MAASLARFRQEDHSILKKNQFYHLSESSRNYIIRHVENGVVTTYQSDDLNIKPTELNDFFKKIKWQGLSAFEGKEIYWEKFLKILNSLPDEVASNLNNDILRHLSQVAIQFLPDNLRIIPNTQLRELYDLLGDDMPKTLSNLFLESAKQFEAFDNRGEAFSDSNNRKPLSLHEGKDTQQLQAYFQYTTRERGFVEVGKEKYQYLDHEVSSSRATKAVYENGMSGRKSGAGGLDLVCFNMATGFPVLVEYKSKNDHSLFYALVQLLTYASELSTCNQLERFKRCYRECKDSMFELAIIFDEDKKKENELDGLIGLSIDLISNLKQYIRSLAFIKSRNLGKRQMSFEVIGHIE